jgi:hypothetical protein
MTKRNPLLDAAIDECRRAGVECRVRNAGHHLQLAIGSSPRLVVIGSKGNGRQDPRAELNVRADVRRSIKLI